MGLLDGRVAIVTGGGRGLGRSHSLALAAAGATVVVNDLGVGLHGEAGGETPAEAVVAEIERAGGRAVADATSVTSFDGVADLVRRVVAEQGRLDAVVNNAGIVRDHMITSMTEDEFDAVVAVHLKGTFNLTKHACDHWRAVAKDGGAVSGRIVNTTSGTGLFGNVGQVNYGAAKAAIANLTVITAMEMQRYQVTANAISPMALTRMTQSLSTLSERAERSADVWDPLDPANASPVVVWLASAESGWLTGQVFRLEGNSIRRVRPWQIEPTAYTARSGEALAADEVGGAMRMLYGVVPVGTDAFRSST